MPLLPNPTNLTLITDLLEVANNYSSGSLGLAILILITFGTFAILSVFSSRDALMAGTFVGLLSGLFLRFLNLINDAILAIVIGSTIAITLYVIIAKNRSIGGV